MARARSPNRDKAFEIYKEHNGNITNRSIAEMLGEKEKTISVWKLRDKWNVVLQINECSTTKKTKSNRGAPKGNRNALGNAGGPGGPLRNNKAVTHGFFRRIFPEDDETHLIIGEIGVKSPLDILWENIVIQYAAIARAQKIMFIKDRDDQTKVLKKKKTTVFNGNAYDKEVQEIEYEYQHAWDKQANFLNAQSRAMSSLQNLIKQYEEMVKSGLATEEQRLRIEKLQLEVEKLKSGGGDLEEELVDDWVEAVIGDEDEQD